MDARDCPCSCGICSKADTLSVSMFGRIRIINNRLHLFMHSMSSWLYFAWGCLPVFVRQSNFVDFRTDVGDYYPGGTATVSGLTGYLLDPL